MSALFHPQHSIESEHFHDAIDAMEEGLTAEEFHRRSADRHAAPRRRLNTPADYHDAIDAMEEGLTPDEFRSRF